MTIPHDHDGAEPQPFGQWLLQQRGQGGFIGQLANSAAADRTFPKAGTYEDARKWMQAQRASGDDWEALEDAERAWLAA
ncbi:YozE family protein [Sphingomonas sp. S2-65]|uniref:YozE family protein n=1 Tax=Sphingomonas sp. S2-65 TaxID=2903960 RepID=UPI001F37079A|nr:YozE family protein [Sphingomonas sp. S2-65]UYY60083.1 sterile alpha motif-like domain-containing protein [Sphingomonas sp. S2-65]